MYRKVKTANEFKIGCRVVDSWYKEKWGQGLVVGSDKKQVAVEFSRLQGETVRYDRQHAKTFLRIVAPPRFRRINKMVEALRRERKIRDTDIVYSAVSGPGHHSTPIVRFSLSPSLDSEQIGQGPEFPNRVTFHYLDLDRMAASCRSVGCKNLPEGKSDGPWLNSNGCPKYWYNDDWLDWLAEGRK